MPDGKQTFYVRHHIKVRLGLLQPKVLKERIADSIPDI